MSSVGGLPVWLIWYQVIALLITVGCIVGWVYWKKVRIFFEAEFWRKANEGGEYAEYEFVGSKEFKKHEKTIAYKKQTYFLDLKHKLGRTKNKLIIAFDVDTGDTLQFGGAYRGGNVTLHDELLSGGVFGRIIRGFSGLDQFTMVIIISLCVGMALTFVLGLFISPYVLPSVPVLPPSNVTGVLP